MTSWKTYRLGDVCSRLRSGKGIPASEVSACGKFAVIGGNGVRGYTDKSNFSGQCVVVGRQGAYCGNVRYFDGEFYMTEHAVVIVGNEYADTHFLAYLLSIMELGHLSAQSAQPGLSVQTLSKLEISLPGLEEQRRIAGILGAIDDKIENNRRINANLELQAQALFNEWLSKATTTKGTFNNIIDATLAGDWGQEVMQGNYTHEVYCIRGADIPALQNGDKGKMPIRYILEKNYITKQLRANDLVIEISGGSPTQSTGRICMVTQALLDRLGKDVVCTNFCRAITPKNGYAIYIYLYWQMLYNKNTMFSYENGTTGIKNFNISDFINKEEIEIPTAMDMKNLNGILQPIYNQIYANGLQNEALATLRDTLLPKLMNGEIKTE